MIFGGSRTTSALHGKEQQVERSGPPLYPVYTGRLVNHLRTSQDPEKNLDDSGWGQHSDMESLHERSAV